VSRDDLANENPVRRDRNLIRGFQEPCVF
jgi:hypothetical protein